jgi:uncharacterized protein YjiS (DUF1127 family)
MQCLELRGDWAGMPDASRAGDLSGATALVAGRFHVIRTLARAVLREVAIRRAVRKLAGMDPWVLADMGIDRDAIGQAVRLGRC